MTDLLTNSLRNLMARQQARSQVAALMEEHGDDFVIFTVQSIVEEKRRKAYDAYVKERDAARAAFVDTSPAGHTSK